MALRVLVSGCWRNGNIEMCLQEEGVDAQLCTCGCLYVRVSNRIDLKPIAVVWVSNSASSSSEAETASEDLEPYSILK
jgi:hypothetical protein